MIRFILDTPPSIPQPRWLLCAIALGLGNPFSAEGAGGAGVGLASAGDSDDEVEIVTDKWTGPKVEVSKVTSKDKSTVMYSANITVDESDVEGK